MTPTTHRTGRKEPARASKLRVGSPFFMASVGVSHRPARVEHLFDLRETPPSQKYETIKPARKIETKFDRKARKNNENTQNPHKLHGFTPLYNSYNLYITLYKTFDIEGPVSPQERSEARSLVPEEIFRFSPVIAPQGGEMC